MSDFYYIKKKIKKKTDKWKLKEYAKIFKERDIMIQNNIDPHEYMKKAMETIDIKYKEKLLKLPKNINSIQVNHELNDIIKTKTILLEKGYDEKYINNYIEREYAKIYNKEIIDFID